MKNLEEFKSYDKIKEMLEATKIIKNQRTQNMKRIPTSSTSEKTQHKELPNAKINDAKYAI